MFRTILISILTAAGLAAAPKLRLSNTTVGPVIIVAGQNGSLQTVEAGNFGDGNLSLTVTSNVPWITASVGPAHPCTLRPVCLPVQIALNTAALAKGRYTGVVTVSDPNAIDAPQTIVVTVQMGGVPDAVDLYLPPNSFASSSFTTASGLKTAVTNPPSGPTISIASTSGGSFAFSFSYDVRAVAPAGTPDGDYRGSIAVTSSTFAGDNKTVPVNVHVTSQPIAVFPDLPAIPVQFRVAQGAAKVDKSIQMGNSGLGTLNLTGATVAPSAPWLAVTITGSVVSLTGDPTGLSPGPYRTTVTIATNARNGPLTVPVQMDVVAPGPPSAFFQGVRDNALVTIGDPVAQGGIVEIVGEQFTTGPAVSASSLPLGVSLGGSTVFVNGAPAPIYYVAASHIVNAGGQINFQIPYDTPPGEAIVRVDRDGQRGNSITVQVDTQVPRLLVFQPYQGDLAGYAIAVINDGSGNTVFPMPPMPGIFSRPAKSGDVLTFYGLGFGPTDPPVTAGLPAPGAEPLARVPSPKVVFGGTFFPGAGVVAAPSYAGLTPYSVGLYQINVTVPDGVPHGDKIAVYVTYGSLFSNGVNIAVQ